MRYAAIIAAVFFLQGCITPALSGKTQYHVKFSDVTNEQNTQYEMKIKAPAGVDLASVTGMTYDWDKDGNGKITVSQDQTTDTTVQAATISEVNSQNIQALSQTVFKLADTLSPLISSFINSQVREGEIKANLGHDALDTFGEIYLKGEQR